MPIKISLIFIFIATLFSCDNGIYKKFDQIKYIGNNNPQLALRMIDSLELKVRDESEAVQMKYDLLSIRIENISGKKPTSDIKMKTLVKYFDNNGSERDIQEAHYYAGCTYRDLHDTPRALEHFLKSLDTAQESREKDMDMMRDTYSNIYNMYYNVHDYNNAFDTAKRELAFAKTIGNVNAETMLHLANSYICLDSIPQAHRCLDNTLEIVKASKSKSREKILYTLLQAYSKINVRQKADESYAMLRKCDPKFSNSPDYNALGTYFKYSGDTDKAEWCYEMSAKKDSGNHNALVAEKELFLILSQKGNTTAANHCAARYFQLSDSIDLAKRQNNAESVGNEFQYHLDRSRMERAEYWNSIYMRIAITVSFLVIAVVFTFYILYTRHRTAALQRQLKLAAELSDTRRQNGSIMQMLHKAELSVKAEDVVQAVKESAKGKHKLDKAEWSQLFAAVDKLYPDFHKKVIENLGTFSEQQLQVCYLMRIGIDNPRIKNVTDIPRTTIWRWTKAYAPFILPADATFLSTPPD